MGLGGADGLGDLKERTYTRLIEGHIHHLDISVGHIEGRCRCRRGSCRDCAGGDIELDVHTAVWQVRWLHWCAIGGCWELFRHFNQIIPRQSERGKYLFLRMLAWAMVKRYVTSRFAGLLSSRELQDPQLQWGKVTQSRAVASLPLFIHHHLACHSLQILAASHERYNLVLALLTFDQAQLSVF